MHHHILIDIGGVLADLGVDPSSLYTGTVTAIDGAIDAVRDMQSLVDTTISLVCTSPDQATALSEWAQYCVLPLCPSVQLLGAARMEALCAGILITANRQCVAPESPFIVIVFGDDIPAWSEWIDVVVGALGRQCTCTYDACQRLCPDGLCATERHNSFCEHDACRQCSGNCNCTYIDATERCYGERCHHMCVPHITTCHYMQCIDCNASGNRDDDVV